MVLFGDDYLAVEAFDLGIWKRPILGSTDPRKNLLTAKRIEQLDRRRCRPQVLHAERIKKKLSQNVVGSNPHS